MAGFNKETSMGKLYAYWVILWNVERKVVGRCQKTQKENQSWHYKKKKMKIWEMKKRRICKDMKDCSMVENENEEVGQHVWLAQVFFRALLVFYMLCMPYIPFLL